MSTGKVATTVLQVGGLNWASEQAVVERVLCRRPGVSPSPRYGGAEVT
jgi:hypothetical protein